MLPRLVHNLFDSHQKWTALDQGRKSSKGYGKGNQENVFYFTNPDIAYVAERELKGKEILTKLNRATVGNILLELPHYKPTAVRFTPAKRFEIEKIAELVRLDS